MIPPIRTGAWTLLRRPSLLRTPGGTSRYGLPVAVVGPLVWAAVVGRRRSFALDAQRAMPGVSIAPQVLGTEHIPTEGACLVVCNHYTRPGLGAWWIALSIAATVSGCRAPGALRDLHWVMTAAWRYPRGDWRRRVVTPVTQWAFACVAAVYGFVTMPPMPPDPDEVEVRAIAILRTVRLAQRLVAEGGLLGLAPEGRDTGSLLGEPPPGAGAFIALLVAAGMPVLPVGVSEVDDCLRLSFGAPFVPEIPPERADRDRVVSEQVMGAIAAQLDR
ncbi:MAG: hypothetical protein MUF84_09360 [Anaerolineae bacterium]|nr:hypothetical protein [Anaerolineae bacterium]